MSDSRVSLRGVAMIEDQKNFFEKKSELLLAVVLSMLIFGVLGSALIKNPSGRVDLEICLKAARNFLSGESVYNLNEPLEHTKPPLGTLLFVPLSLFSDPAPQWIWNLVNLCSLAGVLWMAVRRSGGVLSRAEELLIALASVCLVLDQLNVEFLVGQYNIFALWLILLAAESGACTGGAVRGSRLNSVVSGPVASGFFMSLVVLLKPSNLIFVPWMLRSKSNVERMKTLLSAAGLGLVLACVYVILKGVGPLIADHKAWLDFLGPSTMKHIADIRNLGVPGLISGWVISSALNNVLLLVGLVLAAAVSFLSLPPLVSLTFSILLFLWVSPMTWPQNYSMLVVFFVWIFSRLKNHPSSRSYFVPALLLFYVTNQLLNYSFLGAARYDAYQLRFRPLFTSSLVLAAALIWEFRSVFTVRRRLLVSGGVVPPEPAKSLKRGTQFPKE